MRVASIVCFYRITEVYFGGDTISYERAQCFTCPLCGQMGFTERRLQEHVVTEHDNASKEVVRGSAFGLLVCFRTRAMHVCTVVLPALATKHSATPSLSLSISGHEASGETCSHTSSQ